MVGNGTGNQLWEETDEQAVIDEIMLGDLTVVGVTANVPPPAVGTPDASLPTYSSGTPPQYVLEINAGLAEAYRIVPGERMRIVPG